MSSGRRSRNEPLTDPKSPRRNRKPSARAQLEQRQREAQLKQRQDRENTPLISAAARRNQLEQARLAKQLKDRTEREKVEQDTRAEAEHLAEQIRRDDEDISSVGGEDTNVGRRLRVEQEQEQEQE